ncbi:hypothetical protein [Thermobacillus sp. ZCTH02-B1]|uniref:hypothetical protein n=1 Tax=Thermobacillus sp. ZCTH02-B1 TaxID=1858795 RepID=UPI0025EB4BE0|nr:hypothetical protein [Thermobacillus sp. ZCTH02-B1]
MSDMWLTYTGLAFGVAVAVAGVIAYLRLTRAVKRSDAGRDGGNPSGPNPPDRRTNG